MGKVSWRKITELAGIAAIVASLILVAFELKQNTDMTRAQIIQSRAETAINLADVMINSDYMADIFVKVGNGEELTDAETVRYVFWLRASLRNQDNNIQQYNHGLLPDHIPRAAAGTIRLIVEHSPVSREWWERNKFSFSDEFISFAENALAGGSNVRFPPESGH